MKLTWTHKYQPDSGFLELLQGYDSAMNVYWDAEVNRWVLVRHGESGDHVIGYYDYLDNRTMESLYEGDLGRYRSSKEFEEYIDKHNGRIRDEIRRKDRESREEMCRKLHHGLQETKRVHSLHGVE